jgi:hypothetical protein
MLDERQDAARKEHVHSRVAHDGNEGTVHWECEIPPDSHEWLQTDNEQRDGASMAWAREDQRRRPHDVKLFFDAQRPGVTEPPAVSAVIVPGEGGRRQEVAARDAHDLNRVGDQQEGHVTVEGRQDPVGTPQIERTERYMPLRGRLVQQQARDEISAQHEENAHSEVRTSTVSEKDLEVPILGPQLPSCVSENHERNRQSANAVQRREPTSRFAGGRWLEHRRDGRQVDRNDRTSSLLGDVVLVPHEAVSGPVVAGAIRTILHVPRPRLQPQRAASMASHVPSGTLLSTMARAALSAIPEVTGRMASDSTAPPEPAPAPMRTRHAFARLRIAPQALYQPFSWAFAQAPRP